MIIYFIAFALTMLFAYMAASAYKKYYRAKTSFGGICSPQKISAYRLKYIALFFAAFLPLFLVSALRYGIGTDYFFTYYPQFYLILNGGGNVYSEWGFYYLNKAIQIFTDDVQWLFVVTAFIFVFVLTKIIIKYSTNTGISILVVLLSGIFFASLNNIRQSIAVIICLAAMPYAVNKKFIKCAAYLFVASLFHKTAILMLLFYVVVQVKFIRKNFLPIAVAFTLLLPAFCELLGLILSGTKYKYYFDDYDLNTGTTVNIIYHLFFFILAYHVLGNKIKKDKVAYVLIVAQFISFYASAISIFIGIPELIIRLTFCFQVFQILLIPYVFTNIKDKSNRYGFLLLFIVLYFLYFLHNYVWGNAHEVLPYQWIFGVK